MASTYSDLKIELIGNGEQTGTWGSSTNNNLSIAVSEAITGSADVTFSSADVTVTLTNTSGAQTARNLRLNLVGVSGGARNLILGSGCQIEKLYLVNNTLSDAVTVKNTSGTGIAVPAGKTMFVFNNGTNVVDATTYLSSLTLGSALPVASGGTGLATLTANNVLLGNGTSSVAFVSPSTNGNVLTANGTTWVSSVPAAGGTTIPTGTVILFYQAAAPTGFTQVTTQNNKALRVVSGTGGGTGGSVVFTTAFASQAVSGSVGTSGATTLSEAQLASHTHTSPAGDNSMYGGSYFVGQGAFYGTSPYASGATGGNASHTHTGGTFTGTAINLAVQYIDIILASKD